ncbi:hypothetical protein KP509_27G056200 [Ceratopteris richardii]|uniref:Plant heme peroxidase family profile domain-containing protein n=1 Tax=Ceratopteris richardii TaxID=49495 RepID=A0A8T2RI31_CERRI|nr:hypothetical protein KP509_27G056200 [Ceratopteris richardii]
MMQNSAECGLMSCADITQLSARHAVVQSGGPFYPLALGRRDGFIMNRSLASAELPGPDSMMSSDVKIFRRKGFNEAQIVFQDIRSAEITFTGPDINIDLIVLKYLGL